MTTQNLAENASRQDGFAQFDLAQAMKEAERQKPWQQGHTARMLLKKANFRVVLISMEKESVLKEHHADGPISVQVLKGSIRFSAQGEAPTLGIGNIITLGASIKHEVVALEDSAFLVTIAWPDGEKLEALQHRGYGS